MSTWFDKKYLPFYFILVVIFRYLFILIAPLVITDMECTPHVVDADVFERCAFFKTDYIIAAKQTYNYSAYKEVYFPLDTVFPFVYSLLFMSAAGYARSYKWLYNSMVILIVAGALFDFAENISFSIFLGSSNDSLAGSVSFFSTIKTILFGSNLIFCFFAWLIFGVIASIVKKVPGKSI
jgi:hypothetical protein